MSAGAQISWDETAQAPSQIQWDDEQQKKPEEEPKDTAGFGRSLAEGTGGDFNTSLSDVGSGLKHIVTHPLDSLSLLGNAASDAQEKEFEKGFKGSPAHFAYGAIPVVGPQLGRAATQFEQGNIPGGLGSTAAVAAPIVMGSPEMRGSVGAGVRAVTPKALTKFAAAESNPHALYHSYLDPVASTPHPVPDAPPVVLRSILRDMEAAGDGEAAARIKSGKATVGDLDTARQSANRLSQSIYRSPGNYSPGLAKGADTFAADVRDGIYPAMEQAHGMEPGAMRGVKRLQGQAMSAEKNPTLPSRLIKQGLGFGLGYKVAGPVGGIVASQLAEPLAAAADRGIIGLQTKKLGMGLPEPRAAASEALPVRGGTATGAAADTGYFQEAKRSLGASASISQVARLAQKLKDKAASAR